jgi:hypothetical protein
MERSYWLGRKRLSVTTARSAEARILRGELAGRYRMKAAAAGRRAPRQPGAGATSLEEPVGAEYYGQLETGARWLASRAPSEAERREHLGMANRYARLRAAAGGGSR